MTCIPQSGGCERPFTEAFVEHLNQTGGFRYVHRACLDVASSQAPQPEALYEDSGRNMQLVIERKSISWPIDYPYPRSSSGLFQHVEWCAYPRPRLPPNALESTTVLPSVRESSCRIETPLSRCPPRGSECAYSEGCPIMSPRQQPDRIEQRETRRNWFVAYRRRLPRRNRERKPTKILALKRNFQIPPDSHFGESSEHPSCKFLRPC